MKSKQQKRKEAIERLERLIGNSSYYASNRELAKRTEEKRRAVAADLRKRFPI